MLRTKAILAGEGICILKDRRREFSPEKVHDGSVVLLIMNESSYPEGGGYVPPSEVLIVGRSNILSLIDQLTDTLENWDTLAMENQRAIHERGHGSHGLEQRIEG